MKEANYFTRRRLSRRRVLGTAVAGSAAAAFLAACGGDNDNGSSATATPAGSVPSASQKPGGVGTIYITSNPANFDFQTQFVWHQTAYMNRLFRYKTGAGVDPNYYEIIADLATAWEQDGDQLVVHINPAAKFHNKGLSAGRALTSEDVKLSLQLLATDQPQYVYRYLTDFITSIDTPDANTAVFKLKYPTGLIFNTLAYFQSAIAPKEYIVRDGNLNNVDVGTGPFILEKYEKSVAWSFARNPDYFNKGLPYLDRLEMPFISDTNAALDAFRVGKVDTMTPSQAQLDNIQQTMDKSKFVVQEGPGVGWGGIWPNVSVPPFNDIRVRQAIHLGLDRAQIVDLTSSGKSAIRTGPIPRGWTQWSVPEADVLAEAKRDVAKSKQLLSAAGHPNGLDVDYLYWLQGATTDATTLVVQEQLKDIGVNLKINNFDLLSWQDKLTKHEFTLGYWSMRAYADPDDYLYPLFYPGGSKNYGVVNDPKLTDLVLKQRQAPTNEERKKVLIDIQKRWFNEFLYGIYHVEGNFRHVYSPRLENYSGRNPADHAVWEQVSIKA